MASIPYVFWLVPFASVVALLMAWHFFRSMMKTDEGTPRMREIASHVRKGAMAYLSQQYKVVLIVFIVLALLFAFMAYGLHVQNPWVPFAFLTGGFFSGLSGFFGMKTATYASGRTANVAREGSTAVCVWRSARVRSWAWLWWASACSTSPSGFSSSQSSIRASMPH